MRGEARRQVRMLAVVRPEDWIAAEHPLRRIKQLADAGLAQLSALFDEMYGAVGRPSIPPERLLKASLLMALYSVGSERLLCEQLGYNLLLRWFMGLAFDEPSFDHSTVSRNRARLSLCSMRSCPPAAESRRPVTAATTRATSSRAAGRSRLRRTSRRIRRIPAALSSTGAPCVIRATPSAGGPASGLKKRLTG
jgi:Transposase domain (DUF772)